MPNGIDVAIAVLLVGAGLVETKRGFGRAVLDLTALAVTVRVAWLLAEPLSGSIKLAMDPDVNRAILYVASFVVLGSFLLYLGRTIYDVTLVSAEVFDPPLGGLCGIGVGIILAHALVQTLAFGAGGDAVPKVVADSLLGTEFLRFHTYHRVMDVLYHFNRD